MKDERLESALEGIELTEREERYLEWLSRMDSETVEVFAGLFEKIKSAPMEKKEKTKIDARFLKECEEEFEKAERSGRLHTLMSQSVLSTRAERTTNEKQEFVESWQRIIKYFLPELTDEEVEERIAEGLRLKFGTETAHNTKK